MTAITVNGTEISLGAIASEMQHHPASTPEEAMSEAARALAIRTLLLQRAQVLDLEPAPQVDEDGKRETEEDALVRQVLEAEVQTPEPDEDACRRFYENNKSRFTSPDLYEAAHILFSANSADKDAYAEAATEAQACLETLKENPQAFADMAKARSDCPSAESGGNLGQITRGQVTPEFETMMMGLEPGQLCPVPVKTRYGVHIIYLHRHIPGNTLPFEMVRERIAEYLGEASWRRGVSQYIGLLIASAEIEGIDMEGASSPLVQ